MTILASSSDNKSLIFVLRAHADAGAVPVFIYRQVNLPVDSGTTRQSSMEESLYLCYNLHYTE